MDVDAIQKVSKLASELLQHGMAADKEEALRLADSMLNKKKDFSEMQHLAMTDLAKKQPDVRYETHRVQEPQAQATPSMSFASTSPAVPQGEANIILRKAQNELQEHRKAIIELQENMNLMAKELARMKSAAAASPIVQREKEKPQTALKKETVKENPRSGNWESGDVSIEKYFYSGPPK